MLSVKVYNNVSAVTLLSELVSIDFFNHILYVYFFFSQLFVLVCSILSLILSS